MSKKIRIFAIAKVNKTKQNGRGNRQENGQTKA